MLIRSNKKISVFRVTGLNILGRVGKHIFIPAFFFRKKGYINFVPKSVRRPSVRASVRPCVCASVTFLVIVSPPKPLEVATSNFVGE